MKTIAAEAAPTGGWRLQALRFALLLLAPQFALAETEPTVAAAELVEPALLTGPGYRVHPRAELRGLQARFWVDTDWGGFPVDGVDLLALRIAEMPAVEALNAEGVVEQLRGTGIDALMGPARELGTLASDPVGAASRAPEGLLRYFGDRLRKIGERAQKLGDRIERAVFHDGAPGDDAPVPDDAIDPPWWDKPVDEIGRLLKSQAGHGKARRELAAAFGVEPWTGNPLLRARLDELAWAIAGGRLAIDRLISLASAGTADAIGQIGTASTITAEPPPDDLRRRALQRMTQWTADDDLAWSLAWRGAFPPARLQALLDQIDALAPTAGVEALLDTARMADGEIEARFVANAIAMLLALPDHPVQHGELLPVGALVAYRSTDGEFLLPLPVDRLSWTPEVRQWFDDPRLSSHPRRTVLVAGDVSAKAARALTRRGWSLRPHYRWPGSPPYRRPGSAA